MRTLTNKLFLISECLFHERVFVMLFLSWKFLVVIRDASNDEILEDQVVMIYLTLHLLIGVVLTAFL